ncbi:ATP-grasp domain-containing protein [Nocardia sp. NPDC058058]|uniref:ATP-grasp domain-containing protein n=1 Tax=Nocardia sp. NPDC058058 TaxID=3346317 RepID=UPI0036DE2FA0
MSRDGRESTAPEALQRHDFVTILDEYAHASVESIVSELSRFEIICIVAGMESGVLLADKLSQHFPHLPGNNPRLSSARRDKVAMAECVSRHGLSTIDGARVTRADQAAAFYRGLPSPRAVVKPVSSTGANGVHFVDSEKSLLAAVKALIGEKDIFGHVNDAVLVQEDVSEDSVEYTVNSISSAGHHFVTDVWRMQRRMVDRTAVCVYSDLVHPNEEPYRTLTDFCTRILDAVGTMNGAAHTEIMMRPNGPVLIETSSRPEGACDPAAVYATLGHSQNSLLVAAYLDPEGFAHSTTRPIPHDRHARHVYFLSTSEGPIHGRAEWNQILALSTLYSLDSALDTTAWLSRTTNLTVCPGHLYLISSDLVAIERDYEDFRRMEAILYQSLLG